MKGLQKRQIDPTIRVEDQRLSFWQKFMAELQRAVVETATPIGQQQEFEREKAIRELNEWWVNVRPAYMNSPGPSEERVKSVRQFPTLGDYVRQHQGRQR